LQEKDKKPPQGYSPSPTTGLMASLIFQGFTTHMINRALQAFSLSTPAQYKEGMTWNASLLVLLSSMAGFAVWSVLLGQDVNWDFRNYHYYNAYAVFSGRLDYDVAPAQQQTYLNPAMDLLPYLLIQHFPPLVFGLAIGAWQGITIWLLFLIGRGLLGRISFPHPALWAIICAGVGVKGAASVSEVGTTFHDLSLCVFILGAIHLYLRAWPNFTPGMQAVSLRHMAGSGLLLGLAVGLKLTFALYALGMGAAILVIQIAMLKRYRGLLSFGCAALLGLLLTAGPWMWVLWKQYGNPLFPLYNAIFHSPYYFSVNLTDTRFLPQTAWDALIFPFQFNLSTHAGNELVFRDMRIAILYMTSFVAGVYVCMSHWIARRSGKGLTVNWTADLSVVWLLVFIWVAYIVWLKMFAVYRYLVCIELLTPLVLVATVASLTKARLYRYLLLGVLLFLVFNTKPPEWGRLPWADEFFGVHPPSTAWTEKSVVLVSSDNPLAYVIPSFPETVRFVRVDGNFLNPGQETALTDSIRAAIAESAGNLYLLTYHSLINDSLLVVNQYLKDHVATLATCEPVTSRADSSIIVCRLALSAK
jgi:hypothetical protein